MKIEDCTTEICRGLVEHAHRQEQMAYVFAILGALAMAALLVRWWRGGTPPL